MSGLAVLVAVGAVSTWLLWRDTRQRRSVSPSVWIAVAWAVVYASRPVTSWFGEVDLSVNRDEGNATEAAAYLALITVALLVLGQRGMSVSAVLRDNGWLLAFYVFWCTSVLWSDASFIAVKRLIKDLGNVVVALVLLTGPAPREAVTAVFVRCAYVCIPLSIVLIRYFPQFGRSFVGWHGNEMTYLGVAGHKNSLGMLCAIAAVFLLWDLLARARTGRRTGPDAVGIAAQVLVLAICWYLLVIVNSATSLVCAVLGSLLLVITLPSLVGPRAGRLEGLTVAGLLVVWSVDSLFNLKAAFVQRLGRDMTLTTRTDIWQSLVDYHDSPLLGVGFDSFWTGRRLVEVSAKFGGIIQAHNGYLETYLNGGLVGVALLGLVLVWGYSRVRRALSGGAPDGGIRFAVLLLAIVHNIAEASFNKVSILWLATVLVLMEYRPLHEPAPRGVRDETMRTPTGPPAADAMAAG